MASPLLDWLLASASNLVLPPIDPQGLLESIGVRGDRIQIVLRAAGGGESVIPFKGTAGHFDVTTFLALFLGATDLPLLSASVRAALAFPLLLLTQVLAVFFELQFNYAALGLAPIAPGTAAIYRFLHTFFSTMGILFFPVVLWAVFVLFARPRTPGSGAI
ncbi:MAG: hypothetical protein HYR85_18760 [Planctomycetes bacterium]|nr:hypothetical protein [Planctomycetota bacterium]MBI3847370.1 hypothetical protein [Planctomycetota bacterium]